MPLRKFLRESLTTEIFRDESNRPRSGKSGRFAWSVLVLDEVTMRIVRAAFDTNFDLTRENIARVDKLDDELRAPINMHAIYFVSPGKAGFEIFRSLLRDFRGHLSPGGAIRTKRKEKEDIIRKSDRKRLVSCFRCDDENEVVAIVDGHEAGDPMIDEDQRKRRRKYASASVYLTRSFEERFWRELVEQESAVRGYIREPKVVKSGAAFIPVIGNSFFLVSPRDDFEEIALDERSADPKSRQEAFTQTGRYLANIWKDFFGRRRHPTVFARRNSSSSLEVAQRFRVHLDAFSSAAGDRNDVVLDGTAVPRSKLMILDRGADLTTVLMRDLTLIPLIYDLLPVNHDFYTNRATSMMSDNGLEENSGPVYEMSLTNECDGDWQRLRYLSLPEALQRFEAEFRHVDGGQNKADDIDAGAAEFCAVVQRLREDLHGYEMTLRHNPRCLHRFEVWQSLFRRISSTTAELASISPRFNSNSVFLKCLCWKLSRGELALRDLIAARSDFAAEDDEQPKRLPQRQEKEADALLEAELERLYQDIEGCEARLKTEDVYRKQHELALAIVKALRSKKCAHLKNTYVHLAAECLKKLRIRELYSFIELEKEILLPSSQSSSLRKRLLSSLLTDKSTEIDKFRLIALFGLHANELRSFSGGNEDREDDEGPLQRLLTEAISRDQYPRFKAGLRQLQDRLGVSLFHYDRRPKCSSSMTTTLPATSRASIASTATIEGDDDDDDSWLLRKNKKSVKSAWRLSYQSFLKSFQEEDKEKNAVTSVTWIPLANRLAEFVIKESKNDLIAALAPQFKKFETRNKSWTDSSHFLQPISPSKMVKARSTEFRFRGGSDIEEKAEDGNGFFDEDYDEILLVFIIGGITHSEIRHFHELQAKYPGKKILLGSTCVITADSFLKSFLEVR